MSERKSTGGAKEFSYSREELARIRSTDTSSTKEFKESYRRWQEMKLQQKAEDAVFRKRQRNMLLIVIMLIVFALILLSLRFL